MIGNCCVGWVIEAHPDLLDKLRNKVAYLGFSKCRIRPNDRVPQCFNCQRHGHTAARCRDKEPTCKNCSEGHDSRTCKSDLVKCSNCKKRGHKASSSNCPAKLAAVRTSLRRTDFGLRAAETINPK